MIAKKKTSESTVGANVGVGVTAAGVRYGFSQVSDFGIGPQPTSNTGANVCIRGASGALELRPPQTSNTGGYIDFHYNSSTDDYTSRMIENSSGLEITSKDKNITIKTQTAGKQIVLNTGANNAKLQNAPTESATNTTSNAIATVGWVGKNFIASSTFSDPSGDINNLSDMLAALAGLLNK